MGNDYRQGFYRDTLGDWQPERRSGKDRRDPVSLDEFVHGRRHDDCHNGEGRRREDRERYEREHAKLLDELLESFYKKHGGSF